jgi:acetylornithine deacetylase/succinyl-diaminopimelate desuccinylase-like protein
LWPAATEEPIHIFNSSPADCSCTFIAVSQRSRADCGGEVLLGFCMPNTKAITTTILGLVCLTAAALASASPAADPSRAASQADSDIIERAPAPKPLDYNKLAQEGADFLSKYIQIDTTNPPGNELPAARLLREKFLEDGIPATVWEPQPGRGVIAARLHGGGHHTKTLVLLSHIDVAPAHPRDWRVPPFSGQIKDGAVWGRGAIEDKGPGVIDLMAMLAIKRSGALLNRDILFLATCDKEQGGKNGAGWTVQHEAKLFSDAGYMLNEGGHITALPNGRRFYRLAITEKTPLWLKLTAQDNSARAAIPPDDTAVTRLIRALDRLLSYNPPIRVIDPVRDYFQALAQLQGGPPEYTDIAQALRKDPEFAKKFLAVPANNTLVRDTITPTMLSAGENISTIPAIAETEINATLLPGDDPQEVQRTILKVLDDKNIKPEMVLNFPSASSTRNSQLMTAIAKLAQGNDARVVPTMIPFFTDSHYFRDKGLIVYGFSPIELTSADEKTVHGVNEHISIGELGAGIHRMVQLLQYMSTQ